MGEHTPTGAPGGLVGPCRKAKARQDFMNKLPRIERVEPVMYGALKLAWDDGYEGVVDLRLVLANGEVFEFLRKSPMRFMDVQKDEYGHSVFWRDDAGDEIDF